MRSTTTAIVAAMLAFAVCGAFAASIASAEPPPAPPEPKTAIDHDGTYAVGTDIVPGTYISAGPIEGGTCYWKRLSSLHGNDIIDNAMTKQPQVIQIDATDAVFTTEGCQAWQKTDTVTAPGVPQGIIPALIAQAQLRRYMDTLNEGVREFGGEPLPPP